MTKKWPWTSLIRSLSRSLSQTHQPRRSSHSRQISREGGSSQHRLRAARRCSLRRTKPWTLARCGASLLLKGFQALSQIYQICYCSILLLVGQSARCDFRLPLNSQPWSAQGQRREIAQSTEATLKFLTHLGTVRLQRGQTLQLVTQERQKVCPLTSSVTGLSIICLQTWQTRRSSNYFPSLIINRNQTSQIVMHLNEHTKVAVRVRPLSPHEEDHSRGRAFLVDGPALLLNPAQPEFLRKHYSLGKGWAGFSSVLGESTTNLQLYELTARQAVPALQQGISCSVILYGQTGSGKTYSMLGSSLSPLQPLLPDDDSSSCSRNQTCEKGLVQLFIEQLFAGLAPQFAVTATYYQIYNDLVYDLLAQGEQFTSLPLVQGKREFTIKGVSRVPVYSVQDSLQVLSRGESRRKYASTVMNHISSRSHCVFRLQLQGVFSSQTVTSQVNFVDLAGSQRLLSQRVSQEREVESKSINKSLFFLTQVIAQLSQRKAEEEVVVSYRNSPLTKLLRNSLGGNCRTWVVVCLNPTLEEFDHSLSSIRFGVSAKQVVSRVQHRVQPVSNQLVLAQRVRQLQKRLAEVQSAYQQKLANIGKQFRMLNELPTHSNLPSSKSVARLSKQNQLLQRKVQIFQSLIKTDCNEDETVLCRILGLGGFTQMASCDPKWLQETGRKLQERARLLKTYRSLQGRRGQGEPVARQLAMLREQLQGTVVSRQSLKKHIR